MEKKWAKDVKSDRETGNEMRRHDDDRSCGTDIQQVGTDLTTDKSDGANGYRSCRVETR